MTSTLPHTNKTIIVTGASRGIGRGIALVLSRDEGHTVYATGRSRGALEALQKEVASTNSNNRGRIVPCVVDHADDHATKHLIDRAVAETGSLDCLVNNAYSGVGPIAEHFGQKFWNKPLSVWNASHNVGLRSHYIASALSIPHMLSNKTSTKKPCLIVNISSSGGKSYLFDVAYGCGKAALDRMGCDMATELNGTNISVVTLWPGGVNTETTSFPGAESVEFSGRGIAAMLKNPETTKVKHNGKIVRTIELAQMYDFTDRDGSLPGRRNDQLRQEMETVPPVQWSLTSELPLPTNPAMKQFFQKQGKL